MKTKRDPERLRQAWLILNAAAGAGYRLGTNGNELLAVTPRGMPVKRALSFSRAFSEFQPEIIELILQDAADRVQAS